MKIRFGYDIVYSSTNEVPMVVMLTSQPGPQQRIIRSDALTVEPHLPFTSYVDSFGNVCTRFVAEPGTVRLSADGILEDSGEPEAQVLDAPEIPIAQLPTDTLTYVLGSRYCDTDLLMQETWRLFGHLPPGWSRVQAICDFVNQHVKFGYEFARPTKTAFETYNERQGVCRDYAHLAIAFCRCLNIPARYCTSYLGDIGVPIVDAPMDFAGCMEVFLGGTWHTFDPRNNARRIGRLMIARGRDAADVAISTAFAANLLQSFRVWTDEVSDEKAAELSSGAAVALAA